MIAELLRRSGVVVTAAPELLVQQELLERMSDMLLKFIERWRASKTNPSWFYPEHKISKHFRNAVHAFPLYKIAYPQISVKQVQESDQYSMTARALHVKPTPELLQNSVFRVFSHIFWHLTIVFTENSRVNTRTAQDLGAAYTGDPVNALSIPVYRGTQRFGAVPDAEAEAPGGLVYVTRSSVIHEFRHAFQDYSGSHVWELSHIEPRSKDEGAGRDYYLRPNEVDARLAELIASIRRRITSLVKDYQEAVSIYLKYARLLREGADIPSAPGHKVTQEFVDALKRSAKEKFDKSANPKVSAQRLRKIFAPHGEGFMAFCESVIKTEFPELHKYLSDDTDDIGKSYAIRHLHTDLRELWADMSERYKNLVPEATKVLELEPGEHFYQYGRPASMRS